MKCNNCGGEMEYKENESILIPVGDGNLKKSGGETEDKDE